MIADLELPAWAAFSTAFLLLLGSGLTLTGSLGLLRLETFYMRAHAPTLGTTLGAVFITFASMLFFTVVQTRPVVHEVLIVVFVTLTTPVTLMLLVSAALFRDRAEGHFHEPVNGEVAFQSDIELSRDEEREGPDKRK